MVSLSPRSVGLAARFGARPLIGTGLLLIAAGLLLQSFVGRGTPYVVYALCLIVLAAGMALSGPALTSGILAGLPPERAGLGSGLNSASREIGAAVGVALVGTILNSHGGIATGLGLAYRVLAAVMLVLTVLVVRWWRPAPAPPAGAA
jgi:predicted MFS family arabinose efflux permease